MKRKNKCAKCGKKNYRKNMKSIEGTKPIVRLASDGGFYSDLAPDIYFVCKECKPKEK